MPFQVYFRVCLLWVILQVCWIAKFWCCFWCLFNIQGDFHFIIGSDLFCILLIDTSLSYLSQDLLTKHDSVVSEFLTSHYSEVCFSIFSKFRWKHEKSFLVINPITKWKIHLKYFFSFSWRVIYGYFSSLIFMKDFWHLQIMWREGNHWRFSLPQFLCWCYIRIYITS